MKGETTAMRSRCSSSTPRNLRRHPPSSARLSRTSVRLRRPKCSASYRAPTCSTGPCCCLCSLWEWGLWCWWGGSSSGDPVARPEHLAGDKLKLRRAFAVLTGDDDLRRGAYSCRCPQLRESIILDDDWEHLLS